MPNHVENELYIHGPREDRDNFVNQAEGYTIDYNEYRNEETKSVIVLDFSNFIPYPEEFKKQDQVAQDWARQYYSLPEDQRDNLYQTRPTDGYNSGGYEWCRDNWDTKWNAYHTKRSETKTSVRYDFQTAWSPPTKVIIAMAFQYPTLTFLLKSFECGGQFECRYKIKGNNIIEDITKPYYGSRGG